MSWWFKWSCRATMVAAIVSCIFTITISIIVVNLTWAGRFSSTFFASSTWPSILWNFSLRKLFKKVRNLYNYTFRPLKNPEVLCNTVLTFGFAALLARWGDGKGVTVSLVILPVHSLQLNSDADLLRCLRSEEQRDSRLIFARSVLENILWC